MKKQLLKTLCLLALTLFSELNLVAQNPVTENIGIHLKNSQCGNVISGTDKLFVDMDNPANNYSTIQNYEFEVKDLVTGEPMSIVKPMSTATNGNFLLLSELWTLNNPHFVKTNNGYSIRIRAKKNGVWGEFGTKCTFYVRPLVVYNTNSQNPNFTLAQEGGNVGWYAQFLNAYPSPYKDFPVVGNVNIQWRITKTDLAGNSTTATITNANGQFLLCKVVNNSIPYNPANNLNETLPVGFITTGATYCFELAMIYPNGTIGQYNNGSSCYKYIGQSSNAKISQDNQLTFSFDAIISPNPSKDNFNLDITSSSKSPIEIIVFDINGRIIETKKYKTDELLNLQIGDNYTHGIYTMTVSQGENKKTLKLIKN